MIGKELFEVLVSTVALFGTYIVLDILVILGLASVNNLDNL